MTNRERSLVLRAIDAIEAGDQREGVELLLVVLEDEEVSPTPTLSLPRCRVCGVRALLSRRGWRG